VTTYTRPDGLAPQIGDADDGRFLPLGDYVRADPRSHLHLFAQAARPSPPPGRSVAFRHGGYYVMRAGELYAIIRCGDTGMAGRGGHSHNDQLSFELAFGRQPLVIDPGAYLYTADPKARNDFRSTAYHSTLRVGLAEQNEWPPDYLFSLPDRTRAEALRFEVREAGVLFEGRHHGYERLDPPVLHTRLIDLDGAASALLVRDTLQGTGTQPLEWTFPLAPCNAVARNGGVEAEFEAARLEITGEGLEFAVEEGWYSPSYGVRVRTPFVRARRRSAPGKGFSELTLRALPR